jgi:hypothetical protein
LEDIPKQGELKFQACRKKFHFCKKKPDVMENKLDSIDQTPDSINRKPDSICPKPSAILQIEVIDYGRREWDTRYDLGMEVGKEGVCSERL